MDTSGQRLVTCMSQADESSNPISCRPSQCRPLDPSNSATELHTRDRDEIEPKRSKHIYYVRSHIGGAQNVAAEVQHSVIIRSGGRYCSSSKLTARYLQLFKILYAAVIRGVVKFRHLIDPLESPPVTLSDYMPQGFLWHQPVFGAGRSSLLSTTAPGGRRS